MAFREILKSTTSRRKSRGLVIDIADKSCRVALAYIKLLVSDLLSLTLVAVGMEVLAENIAGEETVRQLLQFFYGNFRR